jgi:hypothetical protein
MCDLVDEENSLRRHVIDPSQVDMNNRFYLDEIYLYYEVDTPHGHMQYGNMPHTGICPTRAYDRRRRELASTSRYRPVTG